MTLVAWITVVIVANIFFLLGMYIGYRRAVSTNQDLEDIADLVFDGLRHRLFNDRDYKGFKTRTQVDDWLSSKKGGIIRELNN